MAIDAKTVKQLREATGAGMMDCKRALEETGGDFQKATDLLRQRGVAVAAKRQDRVASEGIIETYVHTGGQIAVMLELSCETPFVAKNSEFKDLAHKLAMHVAWTNPEYLDRDEVPAEVIERERAIHETWAREQGKPDAAIPKIVEGRMEKQFFGERVLLDQPFIQDESVTIRQLITEAIGRIGETIEIKRFIRWRVGETADGQGAEAQEQGA
ncbi:MAG: translation elongation factor Ts [Armatimonadota bacterium]